MNTIERTDKKTLSDAQANKRAFRSLDKLINKNFPNYRADGLEVTWSKRPSKGENHHLSNNNGYWCIKLTFLIGRAIVYRPTVSLSTKDESVARKRRDQLLKLLSGEIAQ